MTGRRSWLTWAGGSVVGCWAATSDRAQASQLPATIAIVRSSVLPLGTYGATDSPRFGFRGTCFVVGDGSLVATNLHVLPSTADLESGTVMMAMTSRTADQGQLRKVRLAASDRQRDLALLKLEGAALSPLQLAEPETVREGQSIALMGYPIGGTLGFSQVTHRGIVASITTAALPATNAQSLDPRAVRRLRDGNNLEILQLDATAYPGNSGGPVFDTESGRVVGVVSSVLVKGTRESALSNPTGITYAVPVRYLIDLMKEVR